MDAPNNPLEQLRNTAIAAQSHARPLPTSRELLRFAPADVQWREVNRRERAIARGNLLTGLIATAFAIAVLEPNINAYIKASPFGQFFGSVQTTEQKASPINGEQLVAAAEAWVGKEFNPGAKAQCAYFIRTLLEEIGADIGVTQQSYDGYSTGKGYANSFFGSDVGELILDPEQLQPGDLVAFANTYGDWPDGTITHVGIYIGNGMMVDRPTASRPVQKRSIDTFEFAVGIRLFAQPKVAHEGSDFDRAMEFIFKWEGGLSDHPNDGGGKTNMGITEGRAKQHGLTPEQVTKEKATEIYRSDYWKAAGCDRLEYPLSLVCLNTAVNSGVGKAQEFNNLIGDRTPEEEALDYANRQQEFYEDIVSRRPDQEIFLLGWSNRTADLKRKIGAK